MKMNTGLEVLEKVLRNRQHDPQLRIVYLDQTPATRFGDNYTSVVTRLTVSYTTGENRRETISLVRKEGLPGWEEAFRREELWYQEVAPTLLHSNRRWPRLVAVARTTPSSCPTLFLEDVSTEGFVKHERDTGLDDAHLLLAVQELANLHACSIALKKKKHAEFERCATCLGPATALDRDMGPSLEAAAEVLLSLDRPREAEVLLSCAASSTRAMSQPHPDDYFNVICHGDYWSNNLLFRYTDGNAKEVSVLDWQGAGVGPAAIDLLTLVWTSTKEGARDHRQLLASYHSTLSSLLQDVPPLPALLSHVNSRRLFGLAVGVFYLPAVIASTQLSPFDFPTMSRSPIYRQRLLDLADRLELTAPS